MLSEVRIAVTLVWRVGVMVLRGFWGAGSILVL